MLPVQGWQEQFDLALALTIAWHRTQQPLFEKLYEVVAIEPELRAPLFSAIVNGVEYEVVLMLRPDGILRRRYDGAFQQAELKTKASINDGYVKGWQHDLQLIGQQVGLLKWMEENGHGGEMIGGARIEVFLKGIRKKNKVGVYEQQSSLIYAYLKSGASRDFLEAAAQPDASWEWRRGAEKVLVSSFMPLPQWIANLPEEEVVSKCLVLPEVNPTDEELATAKEQWGFAVIKEWLAVQAVDAALPEARARALNEHFPQNTSACWRLGKCNKFEICFGSAQESPLENGYRMREPNHPEGEE